MKNAYYSLTGLRLRLWMRLTLIVGLLLPEGFGFETRLISPDHYIVGERGPEIVQPCIPLRW